MGARQSGELLCSLQYKGVVIFSGIVVVVAISPSNRLLFLTNIHVFS